ncbi:MAG: hypothetical protein HFE63_01150 [Clostridiales bacterium]|nr:hypothetical protein [Clostridiales bacterium]
MLNKVSVLDCTLRDGGYINNWSFGKETIKNIINNLVEANVDIIECGFIRNVQYDSDSSVFYSMNQIAEVIFPKSRKALYAVMIEHHNNVYEKIPPCDGKGVDIIRVTFRRDEWKEAKNSIKILIDKGYKVCVQPVGTTNYDDESLLCLLKDVNELKPYAFYLVDTLGVMYRHDMRKFFYLIDSNLSKDICIGFHSHNNLQMSFSNAQEMIRLAHRRDIIVDSSCYGMGRGVGNLATELFCDYVNNNIEQRYSIIPILNIVDKYLMPIYSKQRWGYDLPYFLSATVKCHPNYAAYLMKKETLDIENIEKILSLIPVDAGKEYDENLIEEIYFKVQASEVDDKNAVSELTKMIDGHEVVILGSGSSIINEKEKIDKIIEGKFVITTNFITDKYKVDALFISNEKRLSSLAEQIKGCVLSTSNLNISDSLVFNYASLLGEGEASDNAGAILIRLLKKVGVKKVYLAGFDGFDVDSSLNYVVDGYKKLLDYDAVKKKNDDICKQLKLALCGINYEVITKSKYEI